MKLIKHAEDIYEIEDFLTIQEQETFMSLCTDDGWVEYHEGNIVKDMTPKEIIAIDKILHRLRKLFDNMDSFTVVNNVRRLKEGEFMWPHADGGDPSNPKVIVFGIVMYLNDDFTGGKLYYSDIGLSIEPKPRSIVIHDAKLNHEVKTVTSGSRYSITAFVFGNDDTTFKYPQ